MMYIVTIISIMMYMEYLPQTIHNRSFKRLRHTPSDEHPVAAAWRDQGHIAKFLTLQEPAEALQRKNSSCRTCQKIRKYLFNLVPSCSIIFQDLQNKWTWMLFFVSLYICISILLYIHIIVLIIWTFFEPQKDRDVSLRSWGPPWSALLQEMFTLLGHGTQVLGDSPCACGWAKNPQKCWSWVAIKYGQSLWTLW
jgi:hypothetical protein